MAREEFCDRWRWANKLIFGNQHLVPPCRNGKRFKAAIEFLGTLNVELYRPFLQSVFFKRREKIRDSRPLVEWRDQSLLRVRAVELVVDIVIVILVDEPHIL